MKNSIAVCITFLFLSCAGSTQDQRAMSSAPSSGAVYPTVSSDSIHFTLSPQWIKTYAFTIGGISKGISMVKDKKGGLYVAGQVSYSDVIAAAILKYDAEGNLLWRNVAGLKGVKTDASSVISKATALAMDSKGNIVVMGLFRNDCIFPSTDASAVVTLKAGNKSADFIAKYSPEGKLLWVKSLDVGEDEFTYDEIASLVVDKTDNIYYCGTRLIAVRKPGELSWDPGVVIGKLDASGNKIWEQEFNSPGRDVGISGVLDSKGNFYFGAEFDKSIHIGEDELEPFPKGTGSFISRVDPGGEIEWTVSPQPVGVTTLGGLAIDSDDNLYISGEYWKELRYPDHASSIVSDKSKNLFAACFKPDGKLRWLKNFSQGWKAPEYGGIKKLKIGSDGFLYLSGNAMGMYIPIAGPKPIALGFQHISGDKSMSEEGFMIKSDLNGNIYWLRTVTGQGNQVISDFVVEKNSALTVTGSFSEWLDFKNSKTTDIATNAFLAYVLPSSLMDMRPDKAMLAQQEEETRRKSISMTDCSCEDYTTIPSDVYSTHIINYGTFKKENALEEVSPDSFFLSKEFIHESESYPKGSLDYSLVSDLPILFRLSPQGILLNVAPCKLMEESKRAFIPLSFDWENSIQDKVQDFNPKEFKGTGAEYYNIVINLAAPISADDILAHIEEDATGENDVPYGHAIQPFVKYVEAKFKIKIRLAPDASIDEQVEGTGKDISLIDEIYNFYLKPREGKGGAVTPAFESQFKTMFYDYQRGVYTISGIRDWAETRYHATLGVKRFRLEIPQRLVNSESPFAMFRANGMEWTHRRSLSLNVTKVDQFCMQPFKLGNSGVTVAITKALPDLSPLENTFKVYRDAREFPKPKYEKLFELANSFTGIYANECTVTIPINNKEISAKGFDFLIGSQEVSGWLEITPDGSFTSEEFTKKLVDLGFREVKIKNERGGWLVFLKMIEK